jgi:hypothetical protein
MEAIGEQATAVRLLQDDTVKVSGKATREGLRWRERGG